MKHQPKPSTPSFPQFPTSPATAAAPSSISPNHQTPWSSSPSSAAAPIRRRRRPRTCRTTSSWRSSCASRRSPSTSPAPPSSPSTGEASSTTAASFAASGSSTGGRLRTPVLGFFHPRGPPLFVPTSEGFALSTATITCHDDWWLYDCRHGRALLDSYRTGTLLVWDLMTGDERYVPLPAHVCLRNMEFNAAVLCAAGHADHGGDCHSCPFLVAFVFSHQVDFVTCACVYSSETGAWSEITSIHISNTLIIAKPTTLIGNILYWLLEDHSIIEFDLDKHSLDFVEEVPCCYDQVIIMPAEDGVLGFAGVEGFSLHLWSRVAGIDGVVTWTNHRVIDMEKLLAPEVVAAFMVQELGVEPIGYAEDADVIFIDVYPSIYMIHLKSMKIQEVSEKRIGFHIFPYTGFYAPGITTGCEDDRAELLNNS